MAGSRAPNRKGCALLTGLGYRNRSRHLWLSLHPTLNIDSPPKITSDFGDPKWEDSLLVERSPPATFPRVSFCFLTSSSTHFDRPPTNRKVCVVVSDRRPPPRSHVARLRGCQPEHAQKLLGLR